MNGRFSLELQEVGAVEWERRDLSELWKVGFGSIVAMDMEDASLSRSCKGREMPNSAASLASRSSITFSVS